MKTSKGFTLIEMIFSITVGLIMIFIIVGFTLSSSKPVNIDIEKQSLDSIIDFVRGEIEYSTDVRFIPKDIKLVPDYSDDDLNWHYFYVKNGELYHDGERVFDKNFTNKKSLSIMMKGNGTTQSNHRLDIKYKLLDNNNDLVYSSRDTILFINLSVDQKILKQGLYTAEYKELLNTEYWLFYLNENDK